MRETLLLNWQSDARLTEAQRRLGELAAAAREAELRLEGARGRLDTLRARLADLEGALVLHRVSDADVAKALGEVEAAEQEAERLAAEHRKLRRAAELLRDELPSLEAQARALVKDNFHVLYRHAVKRLRDAVDAAVEANSEAAELYEQAGRAFADEAEFDPHTGRVRACFLPQFAWSQLSDVWAGDWRRAVGEYMNGEAEEPAEIAAESSADVQLVHSD